MRLKFITPVLLLACSATAAGAQGVTVRPVPAVGEQIRATPATGDPVIGSLAALGGDSLLLTRPGDTAVTVRASEQRVEVLRRPREAWSGIGALAGLAVGLFASQLAGGSPLPGEGVDDASHAVVGGAAGAIVGGLIGFVVAPRRWQRLTVVGRRTLAPPARVAVDSAATIPLPAAPPPPAPPPR
ncbi:MAG TPA: hypothetical protein VF541_22575 [Longimicrobium sp.]